MNVKTEMAKEHRSIEGRGLFTIREAAKYLCMSKDTFRKEYLSAYKIGVIMRGGRTFVAKKHLDDFIEANTQAYTG